MPGILPPKVLFATLSSLKHFRVGDSVIVTDKNNAIYTKQADGTWRADFSDPVSTTLANLDSTDSGTEVIISDMYGKILKSVGTEYREMSLVTSDPFPTDNKQISSTGQVIFTKGKIVSITLLSGSITELTFRDGLVQTYTDTNTTDNVIFTTSSLVVGERLTMPVPFFFGLHATIVGTTPIIALEISA